MFWANLKPSLLWSQLTPSQFEYAALDAEVLLALDCRLHDAGGEAPHPEPKPRARELVS